MPQGKIHHDSEELMNYSANLILVVPALCMSGCFAMGLPPSRTEVGAVTNSGSEVEHTTLRVASGIHSASATKSPDVTADFGVGYLFEMKESDSEMESTRESTHGAYFEASKRLQIDGTYRTWLGLRTEALRRDQSTSLGVSARVGWEVFSSADGYESKVTDGCGVAVSSAYGSIGVGVYAETGVRRSSSGTEFVASTGLSLRLPTLYGAVFDPCEILD